MANAAKPSTKGTVPHIISVTSISPMLQNPMTQDILMELTYGSSGKRKPPKTDVPLEDLASKKLCLGPNGEFGIPTQYLFSALVEAGRQVIFEKKTKISTAKSSMLANLLDIVPELVNEAGDGFIPFKEQKGADGKLPWVVDMRRGVLAANQAAVAIIRPKFPTWSFDVKVNVNLDAVAIEKIEDLFKVAGQTSGLGDFRPSKRGQFGRYAVTAFAEMAQEPVRKAA